MNDRCSRGVPFLAGAAVLTALVAVAVYLNTLQSGFVYDDKIQILMNPWITSARHLTDIFSTHSFGFSERGYQAISYRPMVFVVYMAEHALFGLEPWGWHLVNVLLHAVNSVMVFLLVALWLGASEKGAGGLGGEGAGRIASIGPPLVAGVIFAVHPVNTEAVAWVGCIPELFYTLLMLGSFYLFVLSLGERTGGARTGGSTAARIISIALFFVAALTKETAVLLPLLFFIYDRLSPGGRAGAPERVFSGPVLRRYLPYLAAAFLYVAIRSYVLGAEITPTEKLHPFLSPAQFILNALVLLAKDLGMLLLPLGSYPLQLLDPVYSVAEPRAYGSVVVLAAIVGVLLALRKRLEPLVIFAVFMVVLPLVPTLYAPAISRTPYADRYMYFPSIGYVLVLALVFRWLYSRSAARGGQALAWGTVAAFVLLASVFSAWSSDKAMFWKDDLTLWRSALRGSSENYLAIHSIGAEYFKEGRTDDAIKTLELAITMNEGSPHPDPTALLSSHKVLATAYGKKGLVDRAISEYNIILTAEPDHVVANYNLAALYRQKGQYADAVELYLRALLFATKPWQFADIHASLAGSYAGLGRWGEAAESYENALKYAPGDAEILRNLIEARQRSAGGARGAP